MKFTPVASTTPRVLCDATISGNTSGDIHLQIIFDPKDGARYLSVGIGAAAVRRTWLKPEQATELLVTLATLSPEWSK